jgi:hypothetical protein
MRWPFILAASSLLVSIGQVPASPGTADGVAALARGDVQAAVNILKPIAESWRQSDPVAQFFMGTLYEAGNGVPRDLLRACALYERAGYGASGSGDNPFAMEAMALHLVLRQSQDREWLQDCQLLARVGFDHRFEPVTLHLAAGHSIAWELKGATVTYRGKSRFFPQQLGERGSVFFPVRQTDLPPAGQETTMRHFNELFVWQPDVNNQWRLWWHLFEVSGDELVRIDTGFEPVVTVQGAEPPDWRFFDVRAHVDVRRTPNGDAEWARLAGPRAGTGLIAPRSK